MPEVPLEPLVPDVPSVPLEPDVPLVPDVPEEPDPPRKLSLWILNVAVSPALSITSQVPVGLPTNWLSWDIFLLAISINIS